MKKVLVFAGIDFHVLVTLLFRGWSIIAGGVMVLAIPFWFNKVDQGYYYTFASLIALQVFFELGMNQVIVQIVGHEVALLAHGENGSLAGDAKILDKLTSLVKLLKKWYGCAAVLFFAAVGLSGYLFFVSDNVELLHWLPAWLLLVCCAAVNLYLSPILAFTEGCGQVGQVASIRLKQSIFGYLLMWAALSVGAGLWAMPIVPASAAAGTIYWLKRQNNTRNWLLKRTAIDNTATVLWRKEIFPFQWRIALRWVSGYFIFQIFTPVIFKHYGPVEAGRIGMGLSIFSAVLSVGMSWVAAKVPVFTGLISTGQRASLNKEFKAVAFRSLIFVSLICIAVLGLIGWAQMRGLEIIHRVASLNVLCAIAVVTVSNSFIFAAAIYMRAHKEEPMLAPSIVSALLTAGTLYIFRSSGLFVIMAAYSAVNIFITLPWTVFLFRKYYFRSAGMHLRN